ncbi:hypothetical protein Bca101_101356 [Brassica carinata]
MIGRADIEGSKSSVAMSGLAATSQLSLCWLFGAGKARKSRSQSVPGRHEAVARHVSGSSSPPTVGGLNWDPEPSPRANPFPKGCSPWRPDAVMSATGRGGFRSSGFSRARECTDTTRRARAVGHRNPASVHPASPVLLTKNGPLGALDSVGWLNKAATRPTYLKFENRSRTLRPDASNHWLYPIELASELQLSEETSEGTSY